MRYDLNTRRSFLLGGLALITCEAKPLLSRASGLAPAVAQAPVLFISTLGNQALDVMRGNLSTQQKMDYFRLLLQQDFDLASVAPFVLGPYWRTATASERQEFTGLLDDYIVVTFGRRLAEYGGVSMRVIGNRGTQYEPIVVTEIIRQGAAPVKLEWVLSARGGTYRVTDLIVDGISMAATQRSDFGAIIQRTGGRIAGLLFTMRQIIAGGGS